MVIAVATVVIAAATVRGCVTQDQMVGISDDLKRIAKISENREDTRLQAELRPYLYIKFLEQVYFRYDGKSGKLLYTLTNDGKVSAFEIIRSYKVYRITGDAAIISRSAYINVDFVYALAPQETLEGQPDQIDGINFSEKDISDGSYYLIELYVSYKGTESAKDKNYYSKVEIKVQPLGRFDNGRWNYVLYLVHRDEGNDQDLKRFLMWRDAKSPDILKRNKILSQVYKQ